MTSSRGAAARGAHSGPHRRAAQFAVTPTLRQPAKEIGPRAGRTIARILAATKETFLARGYGGTTIDEITRIAQVSRASFYTYFPGKRDALLALGADSANAALVLVESLAQVGNSPAAGDDVDIQEFVRAYFALLDDHASFAFAWTEAAQDDEEIRVAGMKGHLELCRKLGAALGARRGRPFHDPAAQGLATFAMLERAWSYCRLYGGAIHEKDVKQEIAEMLASSVRGTQTVPA
ncbi:MAG: TetR/AcrR family transcriptional regulator [Acidimicrobiales bacterium]